MNGLDLREMNATDMLDVVHFFFEEDNRYNSAEESDAVDRLRDTVYSLFYRSNYKYSSTKSQLDGGVSTYEGIELMSAEEEENIKEFDPLKQPPKSFIPPTVGNAKSAKPFGSLIDEPFSK